MEKAYSLENHEGRRVDGLVGLRFCLDDEFRDEGAGGFAIPVDNVQAKTRYGRMILVVNSFRLKMSQVLLIL